MKLSFQRLFCVLFAICLPALRAVETVSAPISFAQLGAKATADYHGDALGIEATTDGARLHTGFQKLAGTVTSEGLWLTSTEEGGGRLRLIASSLGREGSPARLPSIGAVTAGEKTATFSRPGLTEEYSVSVDGVRQDFIIPQEPPGTGTLIVELALNGARAETAAGGARFILEGSGRALAYSRLHVVDAVGKDCSASMQVLSTHRLAVHVEDAAAIYPVRIDPTFSDANWVSMNPGVPGADSIVNSMVVDASGNLYVGGGFSVVGTVAAAHIAKWNGSTWSALGSGTNSTVKTLVLIGTDLYAGGYFTTAGGVPVNGVAKWNGSAWSALGTGMNGDVKALAVNGTNLYAGGSFTTAGGVPTLRVAKWDGSTWAALGSGLSAGMFSVSVVNALAVSGNDVYVGGTFTTAGTTAARNVAKWNGTDWSALGTGPNGEVTALAVNGSDLYVGGSFTTAGAVSASNIAKWSGSAWSALGQGVGSGPPLYHVYALAMSAGKLYVGGYFTKAGDLSTGHVAIWNGSAWLPVGGGVNVRVLALAAHGSNLYVGGDFSKAAGTKVVASHIAKWNGSAWSALGTSSGMNGSVEAVATIGPDLYAGGYFTTAGGVKVNGIAKWNGRAWSALQAGLGDSFYGEGAANALAASGGSLYVGGYFDKAGAVAASSIAKWNGSAWSALGSGIEGTVYSVAVSGNDVYVGGYITQAGGVPVQNIAKWNGSTWSALGSGMATTVYSLAVSGGVLYAGADSETVSGQAAVGIAKWNGTAWESIATSNNPFRITTMAAMGTDLYVGGVIRDIGGVSVSHIAKWNGSVWSALGSGVGYNDLVVHVDALTAVGGILCVGGSFSTAGGVAASNLAKWNGTTWSAFGSGVDGDVLALASNTSGKLFVGGSFGIAGSKVSPFIAQTVLSSKAEITVEQPAGISLASGSATVAFGTVGVGGSVEKIFTIRNTGTGPLALGDVTVTGSGSFIATTTGMPASIAAGGNTLFKVSFNPSTSGPVTCMLHVPSNDDDEPSFDITLTGSGMPGMGFTSAVNLVDEDAGTAEISITRSGGSAGTASVRVNSTPGTATLADYDPVDNLLVTFADGQDTASVTVTLKPDALVEPNETFILTLSDPQGGVVLGSPVSTVVRIVDTHDTVKPTVTITAPSANAALNEGVPVVLTGTAADNKGVLKVQVSLNGGLFTDAVTTLAGTGLTATYSTPLALLSGPNTVAVKSIDTLHNESIVVTRKISSTVLRPLMVNITGTGTVTPAVPASGCKVGFPYTLVAKPGTGQVFDGWMLNNTAGTSITPAMQELPSLTFTFQEGLTLTAKFILNPFNTLLMGKYGGLALPSPSLPAPGGTMASNETVGLLNATVTGTGTFTGTLKIDGLALPVTGVFDNAGVARFAPARATSLTLARPGKPNLELTLALDMTGITSKIKGTLTQRLRAVVTAVSTIDADLAVAQVAEDVAGKVSKPYTLVFKHGSPAAGFTTADYPQGDGYATGTVRTNGSITFSGKLADHTAISLSASLSKDKQWPLFAQLYGSKGSIAGLISVDLIPADTDMNGAAVQWFRPYLSTQWYPWGWAEGISVDVIGSQYAVPPASVFPGLNAVDAQSGNATLTFAEGQLPGPLRKNANISPSNVVSKAPATDASFTFSLAAASGLIGSSFTHTNGTKPAFQGVLFQKGENEGGYGYFMTVSPKVLDGTGESGSVKLLKK